MLREHDQNISVIGFYMKKVKVKFVLEQAMKAHSGSRNMAVLIL
jgi:hypothetical protein